MREHLATLIDDFRRPESKMARDTAVVHYHGNRRYATSYGALAQWAGRFAAYLVEHKIDKGDRVLIWAENSADWIVAFYGCMMRGVLAVPLDAAGSAEFAARVAADVRPKLAVGDALLLDKLTAAYTGDPIPTLAFEDWSRQLPQAEMGAISGLTRETPLEILFTSGTTGDPKGVVITHGNVLASVGPIEDGAQPYMRYERLVHPLRILHTLPLSHVFGQTMGLWIPPILRAEVHFESRLAAPHIVELIRSERISVLAAVPRVLGLLKAHLEATYPKLAEQIAQARKIRAWERWWRFRKVHWQFGFKFWAFVSGGGALPPATEHFWNTLGFVLVQGYGMTESTALITLNHPFHVARGTIGKPMPGREVKIGPDGEVFVRGAMISGATWQGGKLRPREEEWLATGDIAEQQESGELKFLGRKSEVIVTAAGLNIHPEDLEAAVEEQPEIAACAVVAMETPHGPEPCAVLALRGSGGQASAAIARANAKLADFQRISRWVLWPEPDLPRTSTGKVRRKPVAAWLERIQAAAAPGNGAPAATDGAFGPSSDWLLALITQITGESHRSVGDELRLAEDLHLDSLGRVQLAAAIEDRLGIVEGSGLLEDVQTLGELRKLVGETGSKGTSRPSGQSSPAGGSGREQGSEKTGTVGPGTRQQEAGGRVAPRTRFVYPTWPWWPPFHWIRVGFLEAIQMPLTWFLAAPRVVGPNKALPPGPLLIVGNHVTAYDGPLIQYALAGPLRRHIAVAMAGDMLDDFRHWRNPEWPRGHKGFYVLGPPAYWLATALFNVFPLPRQRDFQQSFAHAGKAMDRGYSVMVFPEGTRSAAGQLAPFRPGIGMLVKQSGAPVVPTAIRGLGELKTGKRSWFRSGTLEVRVGEAIRFSPDDSEVAITERLHAEVERLLGETANYRVSKLASRQ
jgi:long-chain acyl-CoA synthetase